MEYTGAKRGVKSAEIPQEIIDEILRLHELEIPMKYIGRIVELSTYFVRRTLKEHDLYVNKYINRGKKKSENETASDSTASSEPV